MIQQGCVIGIHGPHLASNVDIVQVQIQGFKVMDCCDDDALVTLDKKLDLDSSKNIVDDNE